MTEAPPVENHPCDSCGQLDTHPMIHVWGPWRKDERTIIQDPSFHFDCLPDEFVNMLHVAGRPLPQHTVTWAARQAALAGTHGDELRAHIHTLPSDNEVEPEDHDVVPGMGVKPRTNVEA